MTVQAPRRHVVSALVVDRPGTLNRVAGLFRARSFNIESLTVGTTHEPGRSRMTVVVRGDEAHLHQVLAQLERLIEVIEVVDLTHTGRVEQELALAEVDAPSDPDRAAAVSALVEGSGGAVLSTDGGVWRLRLAAPPADLERTLDGLRAHGLRSLVRAGSVAMAAGPLPPSLTSQIGARTP
jgi:acetolactate synthase-1/3 small subunit